MTSSRKFGNLKELLQIKVSKLQQDCLTAAFCCLPTLKYASTTVLAYIVYISKPWPAPQAFFTSSCKGEVLVSTQTQAAVLRRLDQDSKWVTGGARGAEKSFWLTDGNRWTQIRKEGSRSRSYAAAFDFGVWEIKKKCQG